MKTFKEFMQEAKQVGVIYYFCTMHSLKLIVQTDPENFYVKSYNNNLSTTRNFRLPLTNKDSDISVNKGHVVRIQIDGNKLSNKHKISPLRGLSNNDTSVFGDKDRVPLNWEENEEVIFNITSNGINLKDHIIKAEVLNKNLSNSDIETIKILNNNDILKIEIVNSFKAVKI